MAGRPHAERLIFDLGEIREELAKSVREITEEGIDWAPAEGMKSYRALLKEIGAMEAICLQYARGEGSGDWEQIFNSVGKNGGSGSALLDDLDAIRQQTLWYLAGVTEEQLERPIPLVEDWQGYFGGATEIEPEELVRWICRHEYYHLGQIIICRWQQGHNPHKPDP